MVLFHWWLKDSEGGKREQCSIMSRVLAFGGKQVISKIKHFVSYTQMANMNTSILWMMMTLVYIYIYIQNKLYNIILQYYIMVYYIT